MSAAWQPEHTVWLFAVRPVRSDALACMGHGRSFPITGARASVA